jgi:hypothetical protein
MPSWLLAGGEITLGLAMFVGLSLLVAFLRPANGALQERAVVSFPAAWIVVGLALTMGFSVSVAFVLVGFGILR